MRGSWIKEQSTLWHFAHPKKDISFKKFISKSNKAKRLNIMREYQYAQILKKHHDIKQSKKTTIKNIKGDKTYQMLKSFVKIDFPEANVQNKGINELEKIYLKKTQKKRTGAIVNNLL